MVWALFCLASNQIRDVKLPNWAPTVRLPDTTNKQVTYLSKRRVVEANSAFTSFKISEMDSEEDIPQESVNLTRTVFRDVWNNFYDWENAYCQGVINSLSQPSGAARGSCDFFRSADSSAEKPMTQSTNKLHAPQKSSEVQVTEVTCWDHRRRSSMSPTRITADVVSIPEFSPYLEYESVTPTSRSIFQGDDDDSMAFIPYPEDPTFDFFDHTYEYKTFSWQDKFHDPDSTLVDKNCFLLAGLIVIFTS